VDNVVIREYGVLYSLGTGDSNVTENLDSREISKTAWDWLLETTGTGEHKFLVKPIRRNNQIGLQVVNYVGVITTPCGYQIEILPKIVSYDNGDDASYLKHVRKKLFSMLHKVNKLSFKSFHNASLEVFNKPLPDVLIRLFLDEVRLLIKKGIRNDYVSIRDETPFLKGRLQMAAQIRQPVGRKHLFQVEYDEFLPDRAENRLIHTALAKVAKWSRVIENQRLANELLFVFDDIPQSKNTKQDFARWLDRDRSMVHYRGLKEWCELIINEESPFSLAGKQHGMSFLFPMNDLFEKYVGVVLRQQLNGEHELKEQASSKFLVERHGDDSDKSMFQLKPDFLIKAKSGDTAISVLDTKWKVLKSKDEDSKYGISQSDMYQLYAYGQKYLNGTGDMFLIYPQSANFKVPIANSFNFNDALRLWVVPFIWGPESAPDYVKFGENRHDWLSPNLEVEK